MRGQIGDLSPAKAQAYIDKVNSDLTHPYWRGDRSAFAAMRAAYILTD